LTRSDDEVDVFVFADYAGEHFGESADKRIEINHHGPQDLTAAEGQELARQGRGSRRGLADLLGVIATGILGRKLGQQEIRATRDDCKEVVKVVGHASGQASLSANRPIPWTPRHRDVSARISTAPSTAR
jgi:hypothetical protein